MIDKAIQAKNICHQLNYEWEAIINHAKQTKSLDAETKFCLLNLGGLIGTLSDINLPQEDLDFAIDVWTSCQIHGVKENSIDISWLSTMQPYLDEAISDEELSEYISQLPDDEKQKCEVDLEKAIASRPYSLQFDLILDNLLQHGFTTDALYKAQVIWSNCQAFDIEPRICADIALYWLKNKYPT